MAVNLSDIIAGVFKPPMRDILDGRHIHYIFKGGRGSCKSSFVSIAIVLGVMMDKNAHALVLRQTANTLGDSVYSQLLWAIDILGVSEYWIARKSPLKLIYAPTGQQILFRGADDPLKIKSLKAPFGYFKYCWYEEFQEFMGMEAARSINQSVMRGGSEFCIFYSYNPPRSVHHWVNNIPKSSDTLVHHSTYLDVPKNWISEIVFNEAEKLKNQNHCAYKNEYLGEITGTGGAIFGNVMIRIISDKEIAMFDKIRRGIDFGYAVDPFVYIVLHYDAKRQRIYIFDEIYKVGLSNRAAAGMIKDKGLITADSAEPKSIDEMQRYGLKIFGAKKGHDSIEYGVKFLQDLEEIVIDTERCPNAAREFLGYEYEPDGNGGYKARYPDKNNHCIDAVRYALEGDMRNKVARLRDKKDFGGLL